MTLGQPVTLTGQLDSTVKASLGPVESHGVIVSALAAVVWPQSPVQNLTP